MLGLARTSVEVVPYAPEWAEAFGEVEVEIRAATSHIELTIEHVGSTSVPGLAAKPIVDIGVLLADSNSFPDLEMALTSIGWIYRGDKGSGRGGRLFVRESVPEFRTHHLHSYLPGAPDWERYLVFRDRLRADANLREEYGSLKRELAKRHSQDRMAYMDAKTEFVERILNGR